MKNPDNNYIPTITTTERNSRVAIWVNMPNGETYNIWDLPTVDNEIKKAVASAFERGISAARMLYAEVEFPTMVNVEDK